MKDSQELHQDPCNLDEAVLINLLREALKEAHSLLTTQERKAIEFYRKNIIHMFIIFLGDRNGGESVSPILGMMMSTFIDYYSHALNQDLPKESRTEGWHFYENAVSWHKIVKE